MNPSFPKRAERYGSLVHAGDPDAPDTAPRAALNGTDVQEQPHFRPAALMHDPMFRWIQAVLLIPPLAFALPSGPGLVAITVFGNAIQVFVVPAMIIGLIWMTNSRKWMLKGYANKWWENLILLVIGGIGFWAAWGIAKDLPNQISGLFGS